VPRVYCIDGITPVVDPSAYEPGRRRIDLPGAAPVSELKAANR
jgi:hypothetical protein